jgi:hypothetical protein
MLLRIAFHKVVVRSREGMDFERILETGRGLPDDESRTLDRPDGPIRLQFARRSVNCWHGELIRIRLGEEPKKANLRGRVEPIPFGEDEGLGEETAFVYDPELRILAYHEHRGGVSLTNAARYFKAVGRVRSIEFQPVLRPEVIERVDRMGTVREFVVHLAGVHDGRNLRGLGRPALSLFGAANAFLAPRAKFHLSIGREGSLQNVKEAIAEFMGAEGETKEQVKKLVVIGSEAEGDDHEEVINLIEDRLVVPVPVDLRRGRLTDARRRAAVYDAWLAQRDGLRRAYGPRA